MKNLVIIISVSLTLSCSDNTKSTQVNEVISFMIDKKAFPLPPPPVGDTTIVMNEKTTDSLINVKLKVALYPKAEILSEKEFKRIPEEYKGVFNLEDNFKKKITLDGITSKKGHEVVIADTTELQKFKDFKDFDLLFWFSDFYFSEDNQKVLFILGVSRSRLWGSSSIYILKKEFEQWQIECAIPVSIW